MIELRPYQSAAIEAVNAHLAQRDDNPAIVIPTAGGKTLIMAGMIREYLTQWPATRILVLAHVRELVAQNADKLSRYWREAPIGIYAASLQRRDTDSPVIFASIQSVYTKAMHLGWFDLVFVDEAHRIPINGEGMYRQLITALTRINPRLRVIGFTATPYRLGIGRVVGADYILNAIAYEAHVRDLIEQGYLCRLVSKGGKVRADVSGVHLKQGEYVAGELERAVDQVDVVQAACAEMVELAADRRAWIVFCAGIRHAEHVSQELARHGIEASVIHAKVPLAQRETIIADFQRRRYRALVNVNVLSEGFDAPFIDAVIMLRPTKSAGLYYQQVGRALRLDPSKNDALVLDFAGNILEHGPIDDIRVCEPRKRAGAAAAEDAPPPEPPAKQCPQCQALVHPSVRRCECGHLWPTDEAKHQASAIDAPILSADPATYIKRYPVSRVEYSRHHKPGSPPSLRVDYYSGEGLLAMRVASEWCCFEHEGYARRKAERWWHQRFGGGEHVPQRVGEVLQSIEASQGALAEPAAIIVNERGKYPEIISHEFPNPQ